MAVITTAKEIITVGTTSFIEGLSVNETFCAVFEDDGDTGYFYALDLSAGGNKIQNAVNIYNVKDVKDKEIPSEIKICWSQDGLKTLLVINNYPHAVFDFSSKTGYCRTGFPSPNIKSGWTGHNWSDSAINLFS